MCDASAAALVSDDLFAAASDEENTLRLYHLERASAPVRTVNLASFLADGRKSAEADIEGAARVGNRVFWITSHGRDKTGKDQPARRRFFATVLKGSGDAATLEPVGRPYRRLVEDFCRDPRLAVFRLEAAARLAPKQPGALNIEGLAAWGDRQVIVGFRNPVPGGRALLVPLENPDELVEGGGPARCGEPILVPLEGRGVRDLASVGNTLYLIGGAADGHGQSRLYRWDVGKTSAHRLAEVSLRDYNAEALLILPARATAPPGLVILSDDSGRELGGVPCREQKDPARRAFRSFRLPLNEP